MSVEDYQIMEVEATPIQQVDAIEKANVDMQVTTAKAYPRNLKRSIDNAIVMATMDIETAQSCGYALPRGGKPITGPSVHLAKIIVSCYGNMRTEAKVVQITDKQVISRGTAWDLENNVASAFEVRRSICGKDGKKYSDDMITVTGNAANAIAYRNAVFAVIPKAITNRVYDASQKKITGDLSSEDKLLSKREKTLNFFKDEYGITEDEVLKLCGRQSVSQIKQAEITLLVGIHQSLIDGDTTVDLLMKDIRGSKAAAEKKAELRIKRDKAAQTEQPKLDLP